jgi:methylenetetrahydrofolate reductase (NADPH)
MSFQKRLSSGEFAVLAEMNTPKGIDSSQFVSHALRIKSCVDAIIVPDMDNGIMRMSALAGGVLVQQQGIEALIHLYCRDRNRIALQGDILAAHALGIHGFIVVCSEDIVNGDHHDAKPVNDLDELGLLRAIRSLEQGKDLAGIALEGAPSFVTGCDMACCPDERALEAELEQAAKKVKAGATFIVTPPVYDINRFAAFMDRAKELNVPIIPTVFLLKSVGAARFIATSDPSAGITDQLIQRIRKASDRENECVRIAGETVAALKTMAQGVRIVAHGWEHRLPSILECAGF